MRTLRPLVFAAMVPALSGCTFLSGGGLYNPSGSDRAFAAAKSGRFDVAEKSYKEAIADCEQHCGRVQSTTWMPKLLVGLGQVYTLQGRDEDAEPLFRQAVAINEAGRGFIPADYLAALVNPVYLAIWVIYDVGKLGDNYADALDELARIETRRGRYDEAEQAYLKMAKANDAKLEQLRNSEKYREKLSPEVRAGFRDITCDGMRNPFDNLAAVYELAGRPADAEKAYKQAIDSARETPCDRDAALMRSQTNLALYYQRTGRLGEAEPLYRDALLLSERRTNDADALSARFGYALYLAAQDRTDEAIATLTALAAGLGGIPIALDFLAAKRTKQTELFYRNPDPRVQRQLFATRSGVQSMALTLAVRGVRGASQNAAELAAELVTNWKRSSSDPLRKKEATAACGAWQAIRAKLPEGAALVEFRQYWPVDVARVEFGEAHLAVLLIERTGGIVVKDVGRLAEIELLAQTLSPENRAEDADEAASSLYAALFGPIEDNVRTVQQLYIAPDGLLYLVPFERLKTADGRYWIERQTIGKLDTACDLLRADDIPPGKGLLALGGIDFGPASAVLVDAGRSAGTSVDEIEVAHTRTREELGQFRPLPGTLQEVNEIVALYRSKRDEPVELWTGADARETRLKQFASPPRVLHLATHGFFFGRINPIAEREKALSGVALAGANRGLAGINNPDLDGILYDKEAWKLNLRGTELVVLSACETGKGALDYYQGARGLVSALHEAGARYVIMTLWPVGDQQARQFMARFYENWLKQPASDPVAALRQTKLDYIQSSDPTQRNATVWSPFVLVGS